MTNDKQVSTDEQNKTTFGSRLKAVRESKGIERREVAAQLRLTEKKIAMMELERYPNDLPPTFIRGYLRAYGRFLQIPEQDIKQALSSIKPRSNVHHKLQTQILLAEPMSNNQYFMHFFTLIIIFTMLGLVGTWWYTHSNNTTYVNNQLNNLPVPPANANYIGENIAQKTP